MRKILTVLTLFTLLTTGSIAVQEINPQEGVELISEDNNTEESEAVQDHRVDTYSLRAFGSFLAVVFSAILICWSSIILRRKDEVDKSAISALLGGVIMGAVFLTEILRYDFGIVLDEQSWNQLRYFLTAGAVGFVTYAYVVSSSYTLDEN